MRTSQAHHLQRTKKPVPSTPQGLHLLSFIFAERTMRCRVTDKKDSLKVKAGRFEATAQGYGGLTALLLLAALCMTGKAYGWL